MKVSNTPVNVSGFKRRTLSCDESDRSSATILRQSFASSVENIQKVFGAIEMKESRIMTKRSSLTCVLEKLLPSKSKYLSLNIGGKICRVSRATLEAVPVEQHFFMLLLSEKFERFLSLDKNGVIFFDFDHRYIAPLLSYCSDLALWDGEGATQPVMSTVSSLLRREYEAFMLGYKIAPDKPLGDNTTEPTNHEASLFCDSAILKKLKDEARVGLVKMLKEADIDMASTTLLYRGSRDGFASADFHKHCDGHPNTVCIVSTTDGIVCGGFTSVSWQLVTGHASDKTAFLFTLAENNTSKVLKHSFSKSDGHVKAVWHSHEFSCVFGSYPCDFVVRDKGLEGWLGKTYSVNGSIRTKNCTRTLLEIEVFQIAASNTAATFVAHHDTISTRQEAAAPCAKRVKTSEDVTIYNPILDLSVQLLHSIQVRLNDLDKEDRELLQEAQSMLAELMFVAHYLGVHVTGMTTNNRNSDIACKNDTPCDGSTVQLWDSVLARIQGVISLLLSEKSDEEARMEDTVTIVTPTITVTTTKATLRQAPEGSPLHNLASDEWGHTLDSDGNIYQDVNSELFVSIINHLRLKALLKDTSIEMPPIVVYEEQKTALKNLLSYYMLSELPVTTLKRLL